MSLPPLARLGAGGAQRVLRAPQAAGGGRGAPRPLAGAAAGDDGRVRQSDGVDVAGWAQQVSTCTPVCRSLGSHVKVTVGGYSGRHYP